MTVKIANIVSNDHLVFNNDQCHIQNGVVNVLSRGPGVYFLHCCCLVEGVLTCIHNDSMLNTKKKNNFFQRKLKVQQSMYSKNCANHHLNWATTYVKRPV